MEITPGNLQALYTLYNQIYQEAFLKQEILWNKVASLVNSKSESETHVWMDRIPQLRKWYGDRLVRNAALRDYGLKNEPYELTIGLDQYKVMDNKISAFEPTVRMIAEQSKKWPDTLLFTAPVADPNAISGILPNGANAAVATTYDGQPFFSTAHPVNPDNPASPTQSNYSGAGSGMVLNHANFATVRQQMRGFKGADGLPLKVNPRLLIVPPALEIQAKQVAQAEWITPSAAYGAVGAAGASKNILAGSADVLVVDDLAGQDDRWYLCDVSSSIKPFIFQLREAPKFVMLTKPDDPNIFQKHEIQYGTSSRGAAGYGPWFLAYSAQP